MATRSRVAESWDNKDFKVWTFHLRKDAKWSNGEPVTAQTSYTAGSVWWIRKPRLLMLKYPQYGQGR
ncbi:ABC transporter substrate-binding protein [Klebsiella pneumoniae]|nr:ABC transporter substrate-binding protein [Klebsiella pneumoniae]